MGAGASSVTAGGTAAKMASARTGQDSSGGNTTHLDVVEGGMQWLATCVEAEKREKEWLAGKYDEKCSEVASLQQELSSLQAELTEVRRAAGAPASWLPRGASSSSCGSPSPLPVLKDNKALSSQGSPSRVSSKESSGTTSPNGGGGGLMGRRGLSLSGVSTGQRSRKAPSLTDLAVPSRNNRPGRIASSLAGQVEVVSPVREHRALEEAAKDDYEMEPMSALLKRRVESDMEWTTNGSSMVTKVPTMKEGNIANLQVAPQKVFSMLGDEDGPASPKRVLRTKSERVRPSLNRPVSRENITNLRPSMTGGGSGGTA